MEVLLCVRPRSKHKNTWEGKTDQAPPLLESAVYWVVGRRGLINDKKVNKWVKKTISDSD